MKILHTSDWHIGRTLYGRKRYEEFEAFLSWLTDTISNEGVDVLLVAGDVFDNTTPGTRAQELYYRFLCGVASSSCRHVVVIAGNHDSPSFLNAPRELLRFLNVYVVGSATDSPADEVLVLKNPEGLEELIVCAVPHLRDRDIRQVEAGESLEDKERKLVEGIRSHYLQVCELARNQQQKSGRAIPIVVMGHLFTAGGQTVEGDGVRELYVGSLAHVTSGIFPEWIDYLALGHLHVPQKVNGSEIMRYSGSPLPMGFGEAKQEKSVCLVEFSEAVPQVKLHKVPVFQALERLKGTWEEITATIQTLSEANSSVWLEIVYDGSDIIGDLRERLDAAIEGTRMEILRVRNNRVMARALNRQHTDETLDHLNPGDVFERCLRAHEVTEEQCRELRIAYEETLLSLESEDHHEDSASPL
ncbi:MAG: exonuclease SbcCD subunit D C-terminal domain-containing protein [SAR324 cluster bacterium]|nr:exonuclease SbcCD subunit D C-terminal domain-containing protein [SAR324 cluster bacterium]